MNFDLNVYKIDGTKSGTVKVSENIFGIEPNKSVMHEVLVAELAAVRQGGANTKTRGEVRGGGAKPFRQKGTGRARQGSSRAPHMTGGGVVHGPRPRSYEKKVNKKVRLLALRSALSTKLALGQIVVLENEAFAKPKTKEVVAFNKTLNFEGLKQLFVVSDFLDEKDYYLYLSARNIERTSVIMPNELSVYWLLKHDNIVITKEALQAIEEVLA